MTLLLAVLACVASISGALLLYIASPQQQWRAAGPWPSRWCGGPGTLCLLLSLAAMLQVLAPVEAVSAWLLLTTFAWSLAPFLGAWRANARNRR